MALALAPVQDTGQAELSPLARLLRVEKFGGALLLSSACKHVLVEDEEDPGLEDNAPEPPVLEAGAPLRDGGAHQRCVAGGNYREGNSDFYREQSCIGVELIARHLEEIGVDPGRIHFADYADGAPDGLDPAALVCRFLAGIQPGKPEVIVYYCGPSAPGGEWAFDWLDLEGNPQSFLLGPHMLQPGFRERPLGYAGFRYVVSDAPYTADLWGLATPHLVGAAAWHEGGMPGGEGGPPLTRWLTGLWPGPIQDGAVFFERPVDVNLWDLPAYHLLFWGPAPPPSVAEASRLLWQVQSFVGSYTRKAKVTDSSNELLTRGGLTMLSQIVEEFGPEADDGLMMQCWWLLHSIASKSMASRWLCQMSVTMRTSLEVAESRTGDSFELVVVFLDFVTTCLRKCARCRASCKHGRHERSLVLEMAMRCIGEDVAKDPTAPPSVKAVAASCRVVAQLANDEEFDFKDGTDRMILEALVTVLLFNWKAAGDLGVEVKRAAAEGLKLFALKSVAVKEKMTKVVSSGQLFLKVLEESEACVAGHLLAMVRSLTTLDGPELVQPQSPSGGNLGEPAFTRKFPPELPEELPEVVIFLLGQYPMDMAVQQWGVAILGALAAKGFVWDDAVGEAVATCAIWGLATDKLKHPVIVDQECLFCVHALLMHANPGGRKRLQKPESRLATFVAQAVSRAAQSSSAGASASISLETLRWGITVLGLLCAAPGGPVEVAPHTGAIVSALLAPYCNEVTALAGIEALSIVLSGCLPAKEQIRPDQKRLVHSLQCRARALPQKNRERMESWVMVLLEAMGTVQTHEVEDEPNTEWKDPNLPPEEDDEVFPYDLEQAAKNKPVAFFN